MHHHAPEWLEPVSVFAATVLGAIALVPQLLGVRARRRGIDAAISADAYEARRVIRAWILAAQHIQALGGPYGPVGVAAEYEGVEKRLERAVISAPEASGAVKTAIREARVLYYKARNPTAPPGIAALLNQGLQDRYQRALDDLIACADRLTAAIEPDLRDR